MLESDMRTLGFSLGKVTVLVVYSLTRNTLI